MLPYATLSSGPGPHTRPDQTRRDVWSPRRDVWSYQTRCLVIPDEMSGHTRRDVWSHQTRCLVIPDEMSGHTRRDVWSMTSCNHVIHHLRTLTLARPHLLPHHTCSIMSNSYMILVLTLVSIGVMSLLERIFLATIQHRQGPSSMSLHGFSSLLLDGIKLYSKHGTDIHS
jgi:hypothetical protein